MDEKEFLASIKGSDVKIVSVGDLVTHMLLSNQISPLFSIVDNHSCRQRLHESKIQKIHQYGSKKVFVENPAGCITEELWTVIEKLYVNNESGVLVIINGEEDLAALPAILLAPSDVTIIYGMPDKGVVEVPATDYNKQKVNDIIAKM
ncbi:MAG: DUF359 domain-containing protein [Candidatus Thermoplasmatota archaeon]|nr:DUF359 domain-containing protein [Candidatus Thermoplasmatota archaeon]